MLIRRKQVENGSFGRKVRDIDHAHVAYQLLSCVTIEKAKEKKPKEKKTKKPQTRHRETRQESQPWGQGNSDTSNLLF